MLIYVVVAAPGPGGGRSRHPRPNFSVTIMGVLRNQWGLNPTQRPRQIQPWSHSLVKLNVDAGAREKLDHLAAATWRWQRGADQRWRRQPTAMRTSQLSGALRDYTASPDDVAVASAQTHRLRLQLHASQIPLLSSTTATVISTANGDVSNTDDHNLWRHQSHSYSLTGIESISSISN